MPNIALERIRSLLRQLPSETGSHHTVILIPHDPARPVITGTTNIPPPNDAEEHSEIAGRLSVDDAVTYGWKHRYKETR